MKKYYNLCFFIFIPLLFEFICICCGEQPGMKSVNDIDLQRDGIEEDNGDNNDGSMEIPSDIDPVAENKTVPKQCSARKENSRIHAIRNATVKQFPFMASLMSISDEHLCSGSVISNGLIMTTGVCAKKQISHALLNTVKAKSESKGGVRVNVIKSETLPTFTGDSNEVSPNNVGIVFTHTFNSSVAAKIKISNYTNTDNLYELEVLGFGLNQDVGRTKDLQYVGVEKRFSTGHIFQTYFDCIATKEPTCFRDKGGPAIFGDELVGLILKGEDDCINEISADYAINKQMAHVLPAYVFKSWIYEQIKKHQAIPNEPISTYPSKLVAANPVKKVSQRGAAIQQKISTVTILLSMFSLYFV